jgi:hypothetical protein
MQHRSSDAALDHGSGASPVPWRWLERRTARAFTLGGILLVGSALVPIGLAPVTEWAWVSGLALVGSSVVAIGAGLLGLVPQGRERTPWLLRGGIICATVAMAAAVGLLLLVGAAVTVAVALGAALPKPMGVFQVLALGMAGGLALGFVLFGVARLRFESPSDTPGRLLVAGGLVLLLAVLGELLRMAVGIGPPSWVVFIALGVLALDTLVVGHRLRSASTP